MNEYFNNAINSIKEWVNIKSIEGEKTSLYPFGEGVQKMLEKALSDAKNLGFEVKNYDNYIGEVIFGEGEDSEGLAILCHLDVVPEGDLSKWDNPPYDCQEKKGYLYGRGVVDNKGPACLVLYALKELKDSGFKPSKKIKLIFGLNEESGWRCIKHYNEVAIMPKTGFSPDANFPVIYAEKGILHVEFLFDVKNSDLLDVKGGDAVNMVCDYASCKLKIKKDKSIITEGIEYKGNVFYATGKTAHGSTPHLGDNAIKKILKFLSINEYIDSRIYSSLFENEELFTNVKDETGNLTFSPNVISFSNGVLKVKTDIRYPSTYKKEDIELIISKISKYSVLSHQSPIMCKKDGELVNTLLSIYNEEFNRNDSPIAIGGGTYARALENGVAFGPALDEEEACHVPNEKISVEKLYKCYNVYKKAIKELSK